MKKMSNKKKRTFLKLLWGCGQASASVAGCVMLSNVRIQRHYCLLWLGLQDRQ